MSTKRTREKKLTEDLREAKALKLRHEMMTSENEFSRTIPDNDNVDKLGIHSFQNGVPIMFANECFPTNLKIKIEHNVNTQKSAEQSGLKLMQLDEKSTVNDHIHNLKASLSTH